MGEPYQQAVNTASERVAQEKPPAVFTDGGSISIKSLAVTYFRIDKANTSIGAERFHFRVRKGIGWFPLAMAARQTVLQWASHGSPAAYSYNLFRRMSQIESVPNHDLPR